MQVRIASPSLEWKSIKILKYIKLTNPKLLNYSVVVLHYVTVSHFIYLLSVVYILYRACPTRYTSHTSSVECPSERIDRDWCVYAYYIHNINGYVLSGGMLPTWIEEIIGVTSLVWLVETSWNMPSGKWTLIVRNIEGSGDRWFWVSIPQFPEY